MNSTNKAIVEKTPFVEVRKVTVFAWCVILTGGLLIGMVSCSKTQEEYFWEIPINNRNAVIKSRVGKIEFEFYLMNEKGIPATRFKQGENFSFYFAMTNHSREKLYTYSFLEHLRDDGFSQVISHELDTIGFPISRGMCYDILTYEPFFGENSKYDVTVPWVEPPEKFGKLCCSFANLNQTFLPKGKYYTDFSYKFGFDYLNLDPSDPCKPSLRIGPLTFKINFIIE